MLSIDYALRAYTDMVNADENIDMQYFQDNLSKEDFKEFQELIPFIVAVKSVKISDRFEKAFARVNEYRDSIYEMKPAANFRATGGTEKEAARLKLDRLFDEAFKDD